MKRQLVFRSPTPPKRRRTDGLQDGEEWEEDGPLLVDDAEVMELSEDAKIVDLVDNLCEAVEQQEQEEAEEEAAAAEAAAAEEAAEKAAVLTLRMALAEAALAFPPPPVFMPIDGAAPVNFHLLPPLHHPQPLLLAPPPPPPMLAMPQPPFPQPFAQPFAPPQPPQPLSENPLGQFFDMCQEVDKSIRLLSNYDALLCKGLPSNGTLKALSRQVGCVSLQTACYAPVRHLVKAVILQCFAQANVEARAAGRKRVNVKDILQAFQYKPI